MHSAGAVSLGDCKAVTFREQVSVGDSINVVYSDATLALSTDFVLVPSYASVLKRVAMAALAEEAVLVSVHQVYHAV